MNDLNYIFNINNSRSTYWSDFHPNQFISFEFLKHKIVPTNYTIKTYSYGNNGCHLKSWVLEGSDDGVEWRNIHEETNCPHLNGSFFSHTFSINQKADFKKKGFKFIRIRQTGANWHDDNRLVLCAIEFYGQILDF